MFSLFYYTITIELVCFVSILMTFLKFGTSAGRRRVYTAKACAAPAAVYTTEVCTSGEVKQFSNKKENSETTRTWRKGKDGCHQQIWRHGKVYHLLFHVDAVFLPLSFWHQCPNNPHPFWCWGRGVDTIGFYTKTKQDQ
jgi:hypothetical protein